MKNKRVVLLMMVYLFVSYLSKAERITITTSPQSARVYVNGVLAGSGKIQVNVYKHDCVTIEVKLEGYVPESRTFCVRKGTIPPPRNEYVQLQTDDSYTSSIQAEAANNEILVYVKTTKTREEAWKQLVAIVLSKFDVLESNDEKAGYLRTSWTGMSFKTNTVRMRFIVKQFSEDPLAYKIKFASEESGKAGTPFSADEQYRPFSRIFKRYDGFIDELTTRLRN